MIFLGRTFCAFNNSASQTPAPVQDIHSISVAETYADQIYVSSNNNLLVTPTLTWDYDTILFANFNGNLLAGNLQFALNSVSKIRIKQREVGETLWKTIFEVPINSQEDLNQAFSYKYARGNMEYEFGAVPVLNNGSESGMNISTCKSEFKGAFLIEKDISIPMDINFQTSYELSNNGTTQITLGREKPFYIVNGISNYDSGTITASFVEFNYDTCEIDINNGFNYRKEINKRLRNKKLKVFKTWDGYIKIIGITNPIQINASDYYKLPVYNFSWTELADINSTTELYNNDFTDIDYENT